MDVWYRYSKVGEKDESKSRKADLSKHGTYNEEDNNRQRQ